MKRRSVYIETTVVSYLTARPSRDVVVAGHQQVTLDWWEHSRANFDSFISEIVTNEASAGDRLAAQRRMAKLAGMKQLVVTAEVVDLARYYLKELSLPPRSGADAFHLGVATWHHMDYLVSWNMVHIANGRVVLRLHELNAARGLPTPVICTPEALLE